MGAQRLAVAAVAALALSACGGGSGSDLVVDTVSVDASAVQAAAPATTGNATRGVAQGLLGYVKDSQPTKLVVMCHGYGADVLSDRNWQDALAVTVRPDTAVLMMDYRDNMRFPVLRGAHDLIAATQQAMQRFPTITKTFLFGVSMGGGISGTAIPESAYATRDSSLLFDYWIDAEGVNELSEFWTWTNSQTDSSFAAGIKAAIEDETGGTPSDVPTEYQRRSPAKRVNEMHSPVAGTGLRALVVVHSANDGIVLYNQAAELAQAASGVGIPTQFFTIGTDNGSNQGDIQEVSQISMAGHTGHFDHPVIRVAYAQLMAMLDGTYDETTPYRQCQVNDTPDGTTYACSPP